jgi:hypothetical protein
MSVRPDRGSRRSRSRQAGKGAIGLIVALVVAILAFLAGRNYYQVKGRYDTMTDFTYDTIKNADRLKMTPNQVREEVFKKAREIGVPISDAGGIEVLTDSVGWRLHMEWDDQFKMPGYSKKLHYKIDQQFRRF